VANILAAAEAARVLRLDPTDALLADMLPQIDALIKQATGRDWALDSPVHPLAKRAAMCRIAVDYDLGAMNQSQIDVMERSYVAAVMQLETITTNLQAVQNVNAAVRVVDMVTYLISSALGLNLIDYNQLLYAGQYNVAQTILNGKPYADVAAIQTALDTAVKVVLP